MADIVIIGGGPVGLWVASQIKKRNPARDIVIYEKHREYQRSHVLKLEHLSMRWCGVNDNSPAEQEFYRTITGKKLTNIFNAAVSGKSVYIRTNDLEAATKKYAEALGTNITYRQIANSRTAMDLHPECRHFIGADGAASRIRMSLMGGRESVTSRHFQHVAELKYEARGKTRALEFEESYKTNKLLSGMAFEHVGQERDGLTPVTVRLFIDEETYAALPDMTFKKPSSLADPALPASLRDDINAYLNVRRDRAGEIVLAGSDKITKTTLNAYVARHFAMEHEGRNWYLAGDAAMGLPYFRSLNAGFMIGSQLGHILTLPLSDKWKINAYNAMKVPDVMWEFTTAQLKDTGFRLYRSFLKNSKSMPWESIRWDADEAHDFQTKRNAAFMPDIADPAP